jgi:dTDP-glucose 4,6-dehydratase
VNTREGEPRHAVVTGGAGFLGSWLCESLLGQGYQVTCVDNRVTGKLENLNSVSTSPRFRYLDSDVSAGLDVEGADVVFHLASLASPVHYQRKPVETLLVGSHGTLHALELAQRSRGRFVLASTSEVYGDPLEHPQVETYWGNVNPVGERSMYDESKRFAEALTMAYRHDRGVDTGIVRIFNTYGPRMARDDGRMVPAFISQALAGEDVTVTGDGTQTRSLCFVADTVEALVAMGASNDSGPVNVGNPVERSVLDVARSVIDCTGSRSGIRHLPGRPDDPRRRCPDIRRAHRVLGWAPRTSWEQGLAATVKAWPRDERRT